MVTDNMQTQWNIREGATVYGADGEKVGKIIGIDQQSIVVEKGFFFPSDYYIPVTAINSADEDNVYLSVTKDEALNQGWDAVPDDSAYLGGAVTTDPAYLGDSTPVDRQPTAGVNDLDQVATTDQRMTSGSDVLSVPVHEEELVATKTAREAGEVTISKEVVTEDRTISVPVTEERVRVNWKVPAEGAAADDNAFQEGTFEVPIMTEEVQVSKVAHKTGEVEVVKDSAQHTEQVSGTVRREEVHVDDPTGKTSDLMDPARRDRGDAAGSSGL